MLPILTIQNASAQSLAHLKIQCLWQGSRKKLFRHDASRF